MSDFYLGEIRAFAGSFAPKGWLPCDGRILNIQGYTALFSLLSNYYGGDGIRTFGLPNLQGAFMLGAGVDPSNGVEHKVGETTNRPSVVLAGNQLPAHTHTATFAPTTGDLTVSAAAADKYGGQSSPQGNILAQSGVSAPIAVNTYATAPSDGGSLNGVTASGGGFGGGTVMVDATGGGTIPILPPYQVVTLMIATTGIYPSHA